MPSVPDEFVPLRFTSPETPEQQANDTGFLDTLKAAGVDNNWPYRAWRYVSNRADVVAEADYDPFQSIRGTKYESESERFAFARSAAETQAIMREWDEDDWAQDTLSKSGWSGTVAGIGMGLLDPTIFLPVAKVFSGVAQGQRALRIGADVAITGGASAAVGEGVMYATKPDYTIGDAAVGVGTATVLSGLLGTGAGALLSRSERKTLEETFQADREAWGASQQPQSAGAAASDTRQLELNTPRILQKLPDATAKISPPRRVLNSDFLAGRRAVVDLVETPYIFKENTQGIATTQGPALDRTARLETGRARVAIAQTFDQLYTRYRFGDAGVGKVGMAVAKGRDLLGRSTDGKATFAQWKDMVDEALRNGDDHAIPEVAEAAKFLRSTVLAPWRDRAIKAGLLPDDVDVKTADSYMMRVWNKEKLIGQRPTVMKTFADWLEGEQTKKAQSRDRISGMVDLKESYASKIDELEQAIALRVDRMVADEARLDEASRMNKSAFMRAGDLREMLDALDNELREAATRNNARGGAVFETKARNRQNLLADRISGRDAEIDDLTRRLGDMQARHDRLQADIEKEVLAWEGNSSRDAKAALKARTKAEADRQARIDAGEYNGKGGRLTSADSSVNAAVRRILDGAQDRTRQELDDLANEIIDRIVGGPDGRLPYDAPSGGPRGGVPSGGADARGPLAHRNFMIPDNLVREYLETDVQQVAEIYLNTMVPDVLLTERFGDIDMTEVFRRLNEEASAKELAATTEKERLDIRSRKNSVEADIAAMRDRIRHTYGFSSDPRMRLMGRVAATAARANMAADLGGATLSSLSDLAGLQWRYGFASSFKNAWRPMLKSLLDPQTRGELGKYRKQMQALGIAAETYLSTRSSNLYDVVDVYRPTSRFERATSVMADKFGLASLLTPWTDFGKFAAGMVGGAELSRAAEAITAGKGTTRQIRNLAEAGIDAPMADRIWKQLSAPGGSSMVDGTRLPNTGTWTDAGARSAFEGALARDVDIMIISPGAEKPLMMSNPVAALILQYKSFVVAANERILVRGLQARDAEVLQGLVSSIALGALGAYAYQFFANSDEDKRMKTPADVIKEGIQRSGVLGWYTEGNSILAKWTGGTADAYRLIGAGKPDARYISRSPGGALLGPTFGKAETTVKSMSTLIAKTLGGDADWSEGDTKNMRRLIAGQNLFYIRRLLDSGEDEINEWLGVEPKD